MRAREALQARTQAISLAEDIEFSFFFFFLVMGQWDLGRRVLLHSEKRDQQSAAEGQMQMQGPQEQLLAKGSL